MQKKITISFNESQWAQVVERLGDNPAPNALKECLIAYLGITAPNEKAGRPKLVKN